jgi:hypothetical protein
MHYANFGEPPAPAFRPHRVLAAPLWGHAAPVPGGNDAAKRYECAAGAAHALQGCGWQWVR